MNYGALCYRELFRPSGIFDDDTSDEMADAAGYEIATAINLHIQSLTKK